MFPPKYVSYLLRKTSLKNKKRRPKGICTNAKGTAHPHRDVQMIFVLLPERLATGVACPFGTHSDRLSVSFSKDSSVRSPHPFLGHLRVLLLRSQKLAFPAHVIRNQYSVAMIIAQLFSFCNVFLNFFQIPCILYKNTCKKSRQTRIFVRRDFAL